MNLQQLEYIVEVDNHRHFARAAAKSFVTQPTLSMMIQKLEEELELKIFDRSRQPVSPTREGAEVIRHARQVLAQVHGLKEFARGLKGDISGELHLGVIPTLAPYLLPLFIQSFARQYPLLKIMIREMVTDEIISGLKKGELDMGLLATPLHEQQLEEHPLFYEEFFVYASKNEKLPQKKYLLPKQINLNHLWLLEEGHCFRNQVFNLCELKKQELKGNNLQYEAGSIETLINLVDSYNGITIVPRLAVMNLRPSRQKNVREFASPKPVREISLVVRNNFPRTQLLENLKKEIVSMVPPDMTEAGKKKIAEIL